MKDRAAGEAQIRDRYRNLKDGLTEKVARPEMLGEPSASTS